MLQEVLKSPFDVVVRHVACGPAQRIPQGEDADVGLSIAWRKHPTRTGKSRGLMANGPSVHFLIHVMVFNICVPSISFKKHRRMNEKHIDFERIGTCGECSTAMSFGRRECKAIFAHVGRKHRPRCTGHVVGLWGNGLNGGSPGQLRPFSFRRMFGKTSLSMQPWLTKAHGQREPEEDQCLGMHGAMDHGLRQR